MGIFRKIRNKLLDFRTIFLTWISLFRPHYTRKICLCDLYPLTPHFYIVKLGFTGVYIFPCFSFKTYIMGTRQNRLTEAVLSCTHNQCLEQKQEKYLIKSSEN